MSLRPLLSQLAHDPSGVALARDGGRAFVSAALRPYLVAALLDGVDDALAAGRPAIVVAGDDRQAQDLATDLRAWLHPRPVRFSPSRGVAYESHLTPPAHLVGLRVAALDALTSWNAAQATGEDEPPVIVVSAVALSEKVPDPALRPRPFTIRRGDLLDLDELAADLVAAGYERVEQVEDRGQFAIRGGIVDVYPATEDHAVRADLFDIEVESLRHFSTFTQRSLGDLDAVEIAPAAELGPEHRELAEIAALSDAEDRPDIAELLPTDRFHALLDLAPADAAVLIASEEDIAPALADHWQDVCAAFHDADAHQLYVSPDAVAAALDARCRIRLSSLSSDQPIEFRAQAADVGARSMAEAEPALEQHVRSGYRTVVTFSRRGKGSARPTTSHGCGRRGWRMRRTPGPRRPIPRRGRCTSRARRCATGSSRPGCGSPSSPSTGCSAGGGPSAPAGRAPRSVGAVAWGRSPNCAPATSSSTRTTASRASPASRRRPSLASRATTWNWSTPGRTRSSCRSTSSRRSRATWARRPPARAG